MKKNVRRFLGAAALRGLLEDGFVKDFREPGVVIFLVPVLAQEPHPELVLFELEQHAAPVLRSVSHRWVVQWSSTSYRSSTSLR